MFAGLGYRKASKSIKNVLMTLSKEKVIKSIQNYLKVFDYLKELKLESWKAMIKSSEQIETSIYLNLEVKFHVFKKFFNLFHFLGQYRQINPILNNRKQRNKIKAPIHIILRVFIFLA
jgi:hypothetical protein